jgi:hypothetical protein
LSLRVTPELKRRLDAAAEHCGRSQSQEAEFRIERSFDRNDLLTEVLTLAYGSKEIAGVLMMFGLVLAEVRKHSELHEVRHHIGGTEYDALHLLKSAAVDTRVVSRDQFLQSVAAAVETMESVFGPLTAYRSRLTAIVTLAMKSAVQGHESRKKKEWNPFKEAAPTLRAMLGSQLSV